MFSYRDLWLVEVFVDVARSGSFAQTARNLHMAPSRVTEAVQRLEQKLSMRCIVRT